MATASSATQVLVVEDDKDIRDTIVEILEDAGYSARGVANGAEALRALRAGGLAELILLDLMMPVMDGWEFLAEQGRDVTLAAIPVLVLSADTDTRERAGAMNCAGLTKPIRLNDLLSAVSRYCTAGRP